MDYSHGHTYYLLLIVDTHNHVLSPWCCNNALSHMLRVLDDLSHELDFHYEIDSGTLLGAVKFNNFIPWDVDGDVYVPTRSIFKFFQPKQKGTKSLEKEGISGTLR